MEKSLMIGLVNILRYSTMTMVLSNNCIASEGLIEFVLFFHVHDHIPHLTDHAKLSVKLSASFSESNKI